MSPLPLLGGAALAASLSGTVTDDAGRPVAGALVQAYDVLLRAEEGETDADGRFRIDDLPAGTWRVRAVPTYTDNLVTRWHPQAQGFCESDGQTLALLADATGVDIELAEGAEIRGRLVDSAGAPIAAEVVWAIAADEATDALLDRPTLTGPTGEFAIRGLDAPAAGAGLWTLYARPEGFPDQYLGGVYRRDEGEPIDLPARGARSVGDWVLKDGILVAGRAVGPGGPIVGGNVHVYAGGQVVTVQTDDAGRYEAVGLPPGDVLPWVSAEGHALTYFPDHDRPTAYAGTVPDEGGVFEVDDLVAPAEARLLLELVDPEDGEGLGGLSGLLYNSDQTVGRGDVADDAGRLVIDRLHPGDYRLYVWGEAAGYADDWVRGADDEPLPLTVTAAGDSAPVALGLPRAGVVSGQVRGESGAPLPGAAVALRRERDGALAVATSDREGRYRIGGLAEGEWTVQAAAQPPCPGDPSAVTVYLGPTVNPAWQDRVALAPGARVEGLDFWLPDDADRDRMGDTWERQMGLDPTRDDGAEDPDGDTYDNLTEYHLGTDPRGAGAGAAGCGGCGGGAGAALLLLPLAALRRRGRP